MLNAVNAVMDVHFLTPVGPSPIRQPDPAGNKQARSEPSVRRYLGAGKYRLYPFDQNAKPYFDEACARTAGEVGINREPYGEGEQLMANRSVMGCGMPNAR